MGPSPIPAGQQEQFLGPIYAYRVTVVAAQVPKNTQAATSDVAIPWVQEGQASPRQIAAPGVFGPFDPPLPRITAFAGPGVMEVEVCDEKPRLEAFVSAPVNGVAQQPPGQAVVANIFPNPFTANGQARQLGATARGLGIVNDLTYAPTYGDDGVPLAGARKLRVIATCAAGGFSLVGCSFVPWLYDPDFEQWIPDNDNVVVVADQTGGANAAAYGAAAAIQFEFVIDETKRFRQGYAALGILGNAALDTRIYFQPQNPTNNAITQIQVQIQRLA